jgi:hypothetical protein
MMRFVVTIKLKPGAERSMAERGMYLPEIWDGLSNIDSPGVLAFHAGPDTGTHLETNWSFAVVIDFIDMDAVRTWFDHPDHRRIGGPVEPFIAETSRVVYEIPAPVAVTPGQGDRGSAPV